MKPFNLLIELRKRKKNHGKFKNGPGTLGIKCDLKLITRCRSTLMPLKKFLLLKRHEIRIFWLASIARFQHENLQSLL